MEPLFTTDLVTTMFVNGWMLSDLDDRVVYCTFVASYPSDNLSSILAMTEALDVSARDFILPLAIPYKIQCRFPE